MRYLGNNTNLVREAVLSALNIVPSDAIYRTDTASKAGSGVVSLSGPYTGQRDTTVDVQIVDASGPLGRLSLPVFTGTGNGVLSDQTAAPTVDPQEFVITLEDLGTQTRAATASLQGAGLLAAASGAAGNDIRVRIDHSGLALAATAFALQEDLKAGTNEYSGSHWDFGAAVLDAEGTIPASAPRIRFGLDPQVYRAYKQYKGGAYVYGFSPAPVRDVPAGARVKLVSGTCTLQLTDGVSTETMTSIVTLYDTLSAIRDHSALVKVTAPIVNDRLPGGMGVTELSVYTYAYPVGVTQDGGQAVKLAELPISVSKTSPTEMLTIRCTDATATGAEQWSVRGDVSGPLADATTNVAYNNGGYGFKIPLPTVPGAAPGSVKGQILVEYVPNPSSSSPRSELPKFGAVKARLGASAKNGTWTYTYSAKPPPPCDSTNVQLEGGPNQDCLGLSSPGDIDVSDASILIRKQRLASAVRKCVEANTKLNPNSADAETFDIDWIKQSSVILSDCLRSLSGDSSTLLQPQWQASSPYGIDEMREPTARNAFRYAVTVIGTSGATEPTWPTTIGATVTDGGVTWTCVGKTPLGMWDDAFDEWAADVETLSAFILYSGRVLTYRTWTTNVNVQQPIIPSTPNGFVYKWIAANVIDLTGASEPTWPTAINDVVVESTGRRSYCAEQYWAATTTYEAGHLLIPGDGFVYKAIVGGTSGATIPAWAPGSQPIVDGTVQWQAQVGGDFASSQIDTGFFERYKAQATDILTAAGIDANFDQAGVKGDGCWQDFQDSNYWWVYDGELPYLPIQTNHYYHSSLKGCGENGEEITRSTSEFGLGPRFACPELLEVGDKLIVTITGVGGVATGQGYQPGDEFLVRTIHADPLPFVGGQTGTDTLTWSVLGSTAGRLADYALLTTAPPLFDDGGVQFRITPGGVPFALGDRFRFSVEGGKFKWRRDGSAWSASLDIATTPLADGLVANFQNGAAPSWKAGDTWTFRAEAVHGVDGLRQPNGSRLSWQGTTSIDITPSGSTHTTCVLLADHAISPTATITLTGSNDDFASTSYSVNLPWRPSHIFVPIDASCSKYRLSVSESGSVLWIYLGEPMPITSPTGRSELGKLTKKRRLPGLTVRGALGATIAHEALPQTSVDALLDMLSHACQFDTRRFAIVPNDEEPEEVGLVEYADETLELSDVLDFQPRDVGRRLTSVSMTLTPAP